MIPGSQLTVEVVSTTNVDTVISRVFHQTDIQSCEPLERNAHLFESKYIPTCVAGPALGFGGVIETTWMAEKGETYLIRVESYHGETGSAIIQVTEPYDPIICLSEKVVNLNFASIIANSN